MRILILSFDSLGDLVLRQPLLRALAESGHELGIAVRAPLLELLPFLNVRLQAISTSLNPYLPPRAFDAGDSRSLLAGMRRFAPDILVSMPFKRTGLDDWLLGRFTDLPRFGFSASGDKTSREVLSDPVPCDEWSPEDEKYRLLYTAVTGRTLGEGLPALVMSGDAERRAQAWLRKHAFAPDRYILGCPGGLQTVGIKGWPAQSFVDVVRYIRDRHGLDLLATGGEADADHLGRIAGLAEDRGVRLIRWIGRAEDLGLLLGLIGSSRLYLGADTGPMHFAAALGKPVAALFGGGTWPRFLPQARRSFVAAQKLPCFGCRWNCWLDEAACLSFVPADRFFEGTDWILSGERDERRVAAAECDGPVLEKLTRAGIDQTRRFQDRLREKEAEIRRQAAVAEERKSLLEAEVVKSQRLILGKEEEIRRQAAAVEEGRRLIEAEAENSRRLLLEKEAEIRRQAAAAKEERRLLESEAAKSRGLLLEKEAEIRRRAAAAEERGRLLEAEAVKSQLLLLEKEEEIRRQAAAAEERKCLLEVEAENSRGLLLEKEGEIRRQAAAAEERGRLLEVETARSRRLLMEKEEEIRLQAAAAEERGRLLKIEAEENKRLRAQYEDMSRLIQDRNSVDGNPRKSPPKRSKKKSSSKTAR